MQHTESPSRPSTLGTWRRRWQSLPDPARVAWGGVLLAALGTVAGLGAALGVGSVLGLPAGSGRQAVLGVPMVMWSAGATIGALLGLAGGLLAGWLTAGPPGAGLGAKVVSGLAGRRASTASAASGDADTEPAPLSNLASVRAAEATPTLTSASAQEVDPTAIRDTLTGAFTQRYFITAADREWSRVRRHGEDAALLMIDADHLKAINEAHGSICGDAVLVQLTRLVLSTLRQYDLMARFNAGVMVVYLPQTDPIGAIDVAERIRDRIANYRMSWPTGAVSVTVSVGVAAVGADHGGLDAVIGDAGAALREAKAAGRNCVRAAPVPPKRLPEKGALASDRRGGARG